MPVYLDTETTGLSPSAGAKIVEVAIVDDFGRPLLNTLVDPRVPIPWQATSVHGITNDMVGGMPTLNSLMPQIREIIAGETVVIYNSTFDSPFFPGRLQEAHRIECAMRRFSSAIGSSRWVKLDIAAKHVRHRWTGTAHRALADAQACRSVWLFLEDRFRPISEPPAKTLQNKQVVIPTKKTIIKPDLPSPILATVPRQVSSAQIEKLAKQPTVVKDKWKLSGSFLERSLCRIPLKALKVADGMVQGFEVKDSNNPDVIWINRLDIDADFDEIYRQVRQFSGYNF